MTGAENVKRPMVVLADDGESASDAAWAWDGSANLLVPHVPGPEESGAR